MITVEIDELTPCLKDNNTGAILETEVIRIKRSGFLKKYKESLSRTPRPIMPSQIPKVKLDMRGLVKYAKERGIAPID